MTYIYIGVGGFLISACLLFCLVRLWCSERKQLSQVRMEMRETSVALKNAKAEVERLKEAKKQGKGVGRNISGNLGTAFFGGMGGMLKTIRGGNRTRRASANKVDMNMTSSASAAIGRGGENGGEVKIMDVEQSRLLVKTQGEVEKLNAKIKDLEGSEPMKEVQALKDRIKHLERENATQNRKISINRKMYG